MRRAMKYSFQMTADEKKQARLEALISLFERANRVFTGRRVYTKLSSDTRMQMPAWTQDDVTHFNEPYMPDPSTAQAVADMTGLNYHEVGHLLYSPLSDSAALYGALDREHLRRQWDRSISYTLRIVWNMLEDMRIEQKILARYESVKDYYISMVMRFLLAVGEDGWSEVYYALVGRTYLPSDILNEYREKLPAEFAEKAEYIFRRFRRLDPTNGEHDNIVKIVNLVVEYYELIAENPGSPTSQLPFNPSAGQVFCHEHQRVDTTMTPEKFSTKGQSNNSSGQGQQSGNDPFRANSDQAKSEQASRLMEVLAQSLASETVQEDLEQAKSVMRSFGLGTGAPDEKIYNVRCPHDSIIVARRLSQEFSQLRAEVDPAWLTHQSSGRLNPMRASLGGDPASAFDAWEEGLDDEISIEEVVLLDKSDSMTNVMDLVCRRVWELRRSVESIGGNVTTLAYNSGRAALIQDRNKRASSSTYLRLNASGGTNPLDALLSARKVFVSSSASVKLLLIVTDGAWCSCYYKTEEPGVHMPGRCAATEAHEVIQAANAAGIVTGLVYIDSRYMGETAPDDDHGCLVFEHSDNASGILTMGKKLVKEGIRSLERSMRYVAT